APELRARDAKSAGVRVKPLTENWKWLRLAKRPNQCSCAGKTGFRQSRRKSLRQAFCKFLFCRFGRFQWIRARKNLERRFSVLSIGPPTAFASSAIVIGAARLGKKLFAVYSPVPAAEKKTAAP